MCQFLEENSNTTSSMQLTFCQPILCLFLSSSQARPPHTPTTILKIHLPNKKQENPLNWDAWIRQTFSRIRRLPIHGMPLTPGAHRSPTKRAIGVRVKPHIYTRSMKRVLAPRQRPHLFTFLKNRQANRTFILRYSSSSFALVLEAGQEEVPVKVSKALAGGWDLHQRIRSRRRLDVPALRAPSDDEEVVYREQESGGSNNEEAVVQHGHVGWFGCRGRRRLWEEEAWNITHLWVCDDGQGFGIYERSFNVICSWYDSQRVVKRILSLSGLN